MPSGNAAAEPQAQAQPPAFLRKEEPRTEAQLREDQRREALARREESHAEEPRREELRPAPFPVEAPVEAPPAPRAEQPRVDSKALLESAGLVMIETDRTKAPAPAPAEEPQHLGRPRRERPKAQPQDEELVQIETTRK